MAINTTELTAILAEVEADLQKAYQAEVKNLKKALPPPPQDEGSESAPGESPAAEDSGSPADDAAMSASPAPEAPPAEGSMPPPGPEGAPADPAADAGQGQPLTPEALQAEYAQLPPEELDMHIQAAMAAKEALQGAAGAPPAEGSMPPGAPEGSMPPPPAMKGELKVDAKANGGVIKSESNELQSLVKSQADLITSMKEDIENLTKSITMVVERPMRKAVTSMADIAPVEQPKTFTKSEVSKLVGDNAHNLSKAERELWLGYVDNRIPASKLAPMLERLTSKQK
jgi:hypothetical protein